MSTSSLKIRPTFPLGRCVYSQKYVKNWLHLLTFKFRRPNRHAELVLYTIKVKHYYAEAWRNELIVRPSVTTGTLDCNVCSSRLFFGYNDGVGGVYLKSKITIFSIENNIFDGVFAVRFRSVAGRRRENGFRLGWVRLTLRNALWRLTVYEIRAPCPRHTSHLPVHRNRAGRTRSY